MNGFELCRRLRSEALTRNTPIVLVTAKVFDKDIATGVELGIDDYIVKPFSIGDVVGRVSHYFKRDKLMRLDACLLHRVITTRQFIGEIFETRWGGVFSDPRAWFDDAVVECSGHVDVKLSKAF